MNVALWIVAGLLAVAFLAAGSLKLVKTKEQLAEEMDWGWVEDFTQQQIRAIGALEVLGAIGLVLPPLLGVAEWLTPVAATGLVLTMVGAVSAHVKRGDETVHVMPPVVLGLLALFVAIGRFFIESF